MTNVVKKRLVLITLAVVIAAGGIIWAIVANIKPKFKPMITDVPAAYTVSGNGSASVMVDNYLYFVGDYTATKDIQYGDNDYYANGTMPAAGIYRVKIENEQPVLTYEYDNYYYDDDGVRQVYTESDTDYYNKKVSGIQDWDHLGDKNYHVESVVPKIAGHDNTAMWVFGNTLIYTTPNNLRNKVGELRSAYLDFYRVDLNGKNHKLVYSAAVKDLTTADFTVWANSTDNIYLLINENGTLQKINVNTQKATQIATDVTAVAFPQVTEYRRNANNEKLSDLYGGVMSYVYYAKNRDSESTSQGNLMYRYQIAGDSEAEAIGDWGDYIAGYTFTPVAAVGGQFIFTAKSSLSSLTKYCIVTNDMPINTQDEFEGLVRSTDAGSTFGSDGDITFYNGKFWLHDGELRRYDVTFDGKVTPNATVYGTDITKVLAFIDNKIYVQTGDAIEILDAINPGERLSSGITLDDNLTMPVAVLRPAHRTGDLAGTDLVFVHGATDIKTYAQNGIASSYLRLK